MEDQIKELMGLVCSYGLLCAEYDTDECDLALSRIEIESKLRAMLEKNSRLLIDSDEVFLLADKHATESREDGFRLIGRSGLFEFAEDILIKNGIGGE